MRGQAHLALNAGILFTGKAVHEVIILGRLFIALKANGCDHEDGVGGALGPLLAPALHVPSFSCSGLARRLVGHFIGILERW